MRFLIVCIFILFGSITAYSSSSAVLPAPLTERLEQAQQAVWMISNDKSNGTAFFVSPRHVVTNWHIIHDQNRASLSLQQEGNEQKLSIKRLVSVSVLHDLALLETEESSASHLTVRKDVASDKEELFFPGYPGGNGVLKYTLKAGPLKDFKDGLFIYFFAHWTPRTPRTPRTPNGGPVLDANNRVVGVISRRTHNYIPMIKGSILREFIAGDIGLNCEGLTLRACIKKEIDHLQEQAKRGSQIAQYRLAIMYYYGEGGEKNLSSARKWYQQAAEQGYAPAQYSLGEIYFVGKGGERNYSSARKWHLWAAEQGHAKAQYSMGAYYFGKGGERNHSLARKWYQRAAEQGDTLAQYDLGRMYYYGEGGKKNLFLARKWYLRAAEQGFLQAQYDLGRMYYHGKGGKKNLSSARKWYRRAAEHGHEIAQYKLGKMYYYGLGGKKNLFLARKWYRRAAKGGIIPAKYSLGGMYYEGEGGEKNLFLALRWYQRALDLDLASARYRRKGKMYYYTDVVSTEMIHRLTHLHKKGKMYYYTDVVSDKEDPREEAIDTVQEKDTTGGQGDDKEKRKANPRLQRLPVVPYTNCRKLFQKGE